MSVVKSSRQCACGSFRQIARDFIFFGKAACATLLFSGLGAVPAVAQTISQNAPVSAQPSATTATYGDWVMRCVAIAAETGADRQAGAPGGESCEIVQTLQMQGQTQPVAQLAFGRLPGETDLIMTAVLPVNISLPSKVHVSGNAGSGDEERGGIDLDWSRCLPGACFAEARPSAETLDVMRTEMNGQLLFASANGQTVVLPLSWRGITAALAALN